MPRFSDLEYDFCCPHRDGCPYLEGLSTHWVWRKYQEARNQDSEQIKLLEEVIRRLDEAEDTIRKLEKKNAQLEAQNLALHRRQFKARRPRAPEPSTRAKSEGKKKRGAPVGHPGWQRAKPDKIDHTVIVPAPQDCPHCHHSNLQPLNELSEHIQEDIVLEPRVVTTCYQHTKPIARIASAPSARAARANCWALTSAQWPNRLPPICAIPWE